MVRGNPEDVWTLSTNTIRVAVRAPEEQDISAFNDLDMIVKSGRVDGKGSYLVGLEHWLTKHSDSVLAPQVHSALVTGWSGSRLDALKHKDLDPREALFASLRFCLENGAPYSNVVGREYLEFLYMQKRWDLVRLSALRIQDRVKTSRRSDEEEAYLGSWGALLDTDAFAGLDPTSKDRLRQPLLSCLRRSLESGNQYAVGKTPYLLQRLEEGEQWKLLEEVALWAQRGCSPRIDVRPYLKKAREHRGSDGHD
jgi:hypothetical protein